MVVYWLFRLTILLTRPLPLRLGYRVAAIVAEICYHFFHRQRRALNENLAWVLGSDDRREVDAVARQAFRNFGKFVIDFIHFPAMSRDEVRRRLVFSQWIELDEVMESGRGMLIVTMHFGSWDLGAAAFAAYDYPINAIADNYGYEKMNELVHGSREKIGMKIIQMDRVGPNVFRALKRGEILALLIDVPAPDQAITVDFLGAPAEVSSVPARIALRTGARVVPAMVLRGPEDDTLIRPVLDVRTARYEASGDEERDVHALTQLMMQSFETLIREHPEQWFIFRRMWPQMPQPSTQSAVTAKL
ncbi:MAG: lysophospholipid acyltransferase family protein [Chloroflexi bacterium]|nr:lysophospholipid acyltransferase family protein [Chloroflexota bacterium]